MRSFIINPGGLSATQAWSQTFYEKANMKSSNVVDNATVKSNEPVTEVSCWWVEKYERFQNELNSTLKMNEQNGVPNTHSDDLLNMLSSAMNLYIDRENAPNNEYVQQLTGYIYLLISDIQVTTFLNSDKLCMVLYEFITYSHNILDPVWVGAAIRKFILNANHNHAHLVYDITCDCYTHSTILEIVKCLPEYVKRVGDLNKERVDINYPIDYPVNSAMSYICKIGSSLSSNLSLIVQEIQQIPDTDARSDIKSQSFVPYAVILNIYISMAYISDALRNLPEFGNIQYNRHLRSTVENFNVLPNWMKDLINNRLKRVGLVTDVIPILHTLNQGC